MFIFTFLNFRMEAYSAAAGSWMARELTEGRGDLLTPLAPLPLPVIGPLMMPFPLPFPLPPCEDTRHGTCTNMFVLPSQIDEQRNRIFDTKQPLSSNCRADAHHL